MIGSFDICVAVDNKKFECQSKEYSIDSIQKSPVCVRTRVCVCVCVRVSIERINIRA